MFLYKEISFDWDANISLAAQSLADIKSCPLKAWAGETHTCCSEKDEELPFDGLFLITASPTQTTVTNDYLDW